MSLLVSTLGLFENDRGLSGGTQFARVKEHDEAQPSQNSAHLIPAHSQQRTIAPSASPIPTEIKV